MVRGEGEGIVEGVVPEAEDRFKDSPQSAQGRGTGSVPLGAPQNQSYNERKIGPQQTNLTLRSPPNQLAAPPSDTECSASSSA